MHSLKKITTILLWNLASLILFSLVTASLLTEKTPTTQTPIITPTLAISTITTTPKTATTNKCIVSISGVKYDVTELRKTHSGGNIFVCNTDMTKVFFSQHDTKFLNRKMVKYRIP